jgi:hypothetical protein
VVTSIFFSFLHSSVRMVSSFFLVYGQWNKWTIQHRIYMYKTVASWLFSHSLVTSWLFSLFRTSLMIYSIIYWNILIMAPKKQENKSRLAPDDICLSRNRYQYLKRAASAQTSGRMPMSGRPWLQSVSAPDAAAPRKLHPNFMSLSARPRSPSPACNYVTPRL